ncbi:amidohydrolase [Salinicoccus halodurans]|uniref:Amidohydrolase n=1 Tax=Salinicoccus halodurans TaxID=407035 RepID=A0A0F7HP18_9STAP|nr:amidohydrolase [Salinicoccus halodurans]AKG74857.1 amidohydrolase [Salinicoccus halodurans]SFK69380.1 amidohydrolase [Salinicoccus halodurans]
MIEEKMKQVFEHMHANPELSNEEVETTDYIYRFLKDEGFNPVKFKNITGLYCDVGNFDEGNTVIGVRADIDALYQEVDGVKQANHSCGHDAHTSMVIGTMLKIKGHEKLQSTGVRFIFQPAEEVGTGALSVAEEGVIENMDYFIGVHLRPEEEADNGFAAPSIEHGAAASIEFRIAGDDAHGARPHLNHNAIEVGTDIVNMLSKIHINPVVPSSVKMTKFIAGGKSLNIIPGIAECGIDLRAQTNEQMELLKERVFEILKYIEKFYDVKIEDVHHSGIVASESHQDAIDLIRKSIVDVLGEEKCIDPIVTSGGDDFHFYTVKYPGLKGAMLGLGCGLKPGLHHPHMTFDHSAMINGTDILYQAILNVE